jgi:hypothetical protein
LLRHPPRAAIRPGAPPPAREVRIIRADENGVARSDGDGIRVLRHVFSYHTHGAWLLPVWKDRAQRGCNAGNAGWRAIGFGDRFEWAEPFRRTTGGAAGE